MYHSSLINALTVLHLIIPVLSLPLQPQVPVERTPLLRRAYSVVAVDGGAAATSMTQSFTESVTLTVSATKTIDRTTTLSLSLANLATPATTFAASTRTISEPGPITTLASTLTREYTLTISLASSSYASANCETTSTLTPSIIANAMPSSISDSAESTTLIHSSTAAILTNGNPPIPTTQSHRAGLSYTASRSWNSTTVSSYGPTGTGSTARILSSSWSHTP